MTRVARSIIGLACLGTVVFVLGCSRGDPRTRGPKPPEGFDWDSEPFSLGKHVVVRHYCFDCHTINNIGPFAQPGGPAVQPVGGARPAFVEPGAAPGGPAPQP